MSSSENKKSKTESTNSGEKNVKSAKYNVFTLNLSTMFISER